MHPRVAVTALAASVCIAATALAMAVLAPVGSADTLMVTAPTATSPTSPSPTPAARPGTTTFTVAVTTVDDWGSGRTMHLAVTNTGSKPITGWTITLPWAGTVSSIWDATGGARDGVLTATNETWNGSLAVGDAATVGFNDSGPLALPSACTSAVGTCTVVAATKAASTPAVVAPVVTSTNPMASGTSRTGVKKIVGYYPSWATYERNYQVADIPANKLTHVNFAFANVVDGRCAVGDAYADTDKAFAGDTWDAGVLRGNVNQLIKLRAAHPKLKTLISVGGWTWSANFSKAAATPASRKAFASSCVDFMRTYRFDGIDIDWEYPVSGGLQAGSSRDKRNFTLLLRELRAQLEATSVGRRHYLLTIAAPAGPQNIANLELPSIGATVDWINLMTYDYHGGWAATTGHNAPLSRGAADPSPRGFTVRETVNAYLAGGVPAAKLVLGVPFYGRGWQDVRSIGAGLYQPGRAADIGTWEKAMFDYTDIRKTYLPTMKRTWDAAAQVPTLYDPVRHLFISYDDPQSVAIKAEYINAMGLGGAMVWELSGDRDHELLDTLDATLR